MLQNVVPFFSRFISFSPHSKLIVGGDFNCYDSSRDQFGGNVFLSSNLSNFKSCFELVYAWGLKHPGESQCTWFNADFSIGSRLDPVSFPVRFLLKCLFVKFLRALFVITILFL